MSIAPCTRRAALTLTLAILTALTVMAPATSWPTKPLTLVVPFPAGGEDFGRFVPAEIKRWAEVVKSSGVKLD